MTKKTHRYLWPQCSHVKQKKWSEIKWSPKDAGMRTKPQAVDF